tara:strand:+ start:4570 stop:5517 length:948 start_codon:yes stop_codon:yes gene_type:complete
MKNIKVIQTKYDMLVIDWILSNICNYKCSYCGPSSNGGYFKWPSLEECKLIISQIKKQSTHKYRFYTLLGGEPTLWKNFQPLCELIKENDNNTVINILTNGYRSLSWWNKSKLFLDKVSISFHYNLAKTEHIIDVVNCIEDSCQVNVQLLLDKNNFDKCEYNFWKILEGIDGINKRIPVIPKKLQTIFGDPSWMEYTNKQKEKITKMFEISKKIIPQKKNICALGMRVTYEDNTTEKIGNHELILNNKNRFKNWKCKIGQDLIVIKDKKVYLSNACNTHKTLGDIQNFKLLDKPIICEYNECICGSDIEITKWKI